MNDTYFGQLLISMPSLKDPFFQKTVILICEFTEKAIMGLIINKPILDMKEKDILKNLNLKIDKNVINKNVFIGGPVHTNQGFIIHSNEINYEDSEKISNKLMLTTSIKVLEDISKNNPPKSYKIFLGCSVWESKQFNNEMLQNSWHLTKTDDKIIFEKNNNSKIWETCITNSGIIKEKLNPYYGNA